MGFNSGFKGLTITQKNWMKEMRKLKRQILYFLNKHTHLLSSTNLRAYVPCVWVCVCVCVCV